MANPTTSSGTHQTREREKIASVRRSTADPGFEYTFENFFHPFVGELIEKLNQESLAGLLDAKFHKELKKDESHNPAIETDGSFDFYRNFGYEKPADSDRVTVNGFPKEIDLSVGGPYANYNWELLFHVPLTIAVHLSKNQRFAEAQRWFHYIFDPTSNDASTEPPERYWKFLRFRERDITRPDELVAILSRPESELDDDQRKQQEDASRGLEEIKNKPFQPHVVARARHVSYQYYVVMKYLDNLIAWGDSLFMQDTIESINEATQLYVLASNILGERPQRIPPSGTVRAKSYRQLKDQGLGPIKNAFVAMEHQFPFNASLATLSDDPDAARALFGIGRTLYFCVPRNEKLLGYWDTVADRLFKIRHCMNIEGVTRQIALFDPPLDPGMLVKAAAAGIDIGSIVAGRNQPVGPVRSLFVIQKALELCGEVRNLGSALLSAIEKGESERLSLLRQSHEIKLQEMVKEVRFLHWKQAQESTESLLRSRASALERYRFYLRVLGQAPNDAAPDTIALDRRELTEENFDEAFAALVGQYDKTIPPSEYPPFETKQEGRLHLHKGEYEELEYGDSAHLDRLLATGAEGAMAAITLIPDLDLNASFWGVGTTHKLKVGEALVNIGKAASAKFSIDAQIDEHKGQYAAKTASYERRADDWLFQANLAALELKQIGRQILGSLIGEQLAYREHQNIQKQIEQSNEVDRFLHEKFSNEELYAWMQGELMRLYYEYYRFAFDASRKAKRTMKHELMRPEIDATEYIKFNYWDGGRKGLLSGEALHLDLKRMEMAYHEHNKREYELTKHISLRQLDPIALLTLKATGSCEVNLPEWLFDLDTPGHYMRRIKNVSVSIPAVTGPYTGVTCTVSLLKSTLRRSPLLRDDEYPRAPDEDDTRFVDYYGTTQSIVTSNAQNDSGMFETNLRDERFLPFEGHGAISTWRLELPAEFRQFDYNTISDVILHLRFTARQGGALLREKATEHLRILVQEANTFGLVQVFSLKHEFPSEWHRFVADDESFVATIKKEHFPYFVQGENIQISQGEIYVIRKKELSPSLAFEGELAGALGNGRDVEIKKRPDSELDKDAQVFLVVRYHI